MKISYNWLKNYIDLDETEHAPEVLAEVLPFLGFEIEEQLQLGPPPLDNVVVGEVLEFEQHPDADRLRCCKVSTGEPDAAPHSIVCGAKNFTAGDRVAVALPGAVLPGNFKIKKSKLRGQPSEGMMCSAKELQTGDDHEGILILDKQIPLGTSINDVFTDGDTIFDLEVTPNRADALSHIGIARELAARFGLKVKYPEIKTDIEKATKGTSSLLAGVEVEAPEVCPHYTATCIKGVKVGPSPKWLRQAIEAIGLGSINNVVDVTNYVLHETGQPLHAFDANKIRGGKLYIRGATEGELITTLDEKERSLSSDMTVIADTERPLVVAGIMGSLEAEVDDATVNIVLEAAYFDPSSVRSTARKLKLSSDSSYRFERGVDPQGVETAALRAVDLILEVAGGIVEGEMLVVGSPIEMTDTITIQPNAIRKFIGFEVGDSEIRQALESLGLSVSVDNDGDLESWNVSIPSYRGDLQREVDLIEEFVRLYGTDKIPESAVVARGISHVDHRMYTFNDAAAEYLTGQNFNEAYLYSLRDPEETKHFFGDELFKLLALANPLQSDQSHLRPSLIPGLLDVLKLNNARGTGATRFFEHGHVFREIKGELVELISVSFVMVADPVGRNWRQRESVDFYTARTVNNTILKLAGVDPAKLGYQRINECKLWQGGQSAYVGEFGKMGFECTVGLLNVETLKTRWEIDNLVFAGSILFRPDLFERKTKRSRYHEISNQPASIKDLALIVDQTILASDVEKEIAKFAKKATQGFDCESVGIFDVYQGTGLPEGKKSLAVAMSFRAADRTLKDKEVNAAFEGIQKLIAEKTDYQIRK